MRTRYPYLALLIGLNLPTAVAAQQITMSGWVDRVDTQASTITLRTFGNPRTIQVAPDAIVRVNGAVTRLSLIPINSEVAILAAKGPNNVLRATEITVTTSSGQPAAAAPPGSVLTGTLVGMNIPANQITLRTVAGDFTVPLGSAPILVNGRRGNTRHLQIGQLIHVERALLTEGATDYVTQMVRVLGPGTMPRMGTRTWRSALPAPGSLFRRGTDGFPQVTISVDQTELATRGVLVNGRALVPIRELVEHLEGELLWDPDRKTAWATFPAQGRTVRLAVDSPVALTYDYAADDPHRTGRLIRSTRLDQPPVLLGGRVHAPVAAAAAVAGASVLFQPETRQVFVATQPTIGP